MTVGSLFSGIGGLDLGFEWAGFETKWFCEIEPYPQKVLAKHWPGVPIYNDVKEITAERVIPVDCIIGGFPCQDISYAGKGAGIDYDLSEQEGTRSGLWWEMWRVIRELRPRYVVAENVSALTNRGLNIVLGSLAEIGYDAEWQIVSAAAVGAPHIRERIFIVAYPEHGGVQVGRGNNDDSGQAGGQGSVCVNDKGRSEVEAREALAHAGGKGLEGQRRNGTRIDKPGREPQGQNRQVGREGIQPDWFAGTEGQPHPVSFKLDMEHAERKRSGGRGDELKESVEGEGSAPRLFQGVEAEYDFRGVAHGVSDRVSRLKGLGNAVVPQVAYLIAQVVKLHSEGR